MSCEYLVKKRCTLCDQGVACAKMIELKENTFNRLTRLLNKDIFAFTNMTDSGMIYRFASCVIEEYEDIDELFEALSDENQIAYFMKAIF